MSVISHSETQQASVFRGRFQVMHPEQTSTSPVASGKVPNISYISMFHLCARLPSSCAVIQSHLRYLIFFIQQIGEFQHLTS